MNFHLKSIFISTLLGVTLSGCATSSPSQSAEFFSPPYKRITATGYGTAEKSDKYSRSQIKLMALRSSKLDAFRSLSEQVYGVRLHGTTTVENMIIHHDSYKSYVDAYLRGARILRSASINKDMYAGDDTFETVVELELTPHFYECMSGSFEEVNRCLQQPMPPASESELVSPFSKATPTDLPSNKTAMASSVIENSTPAHCNSMDCYEYPLTLGFNRPFQNDFLQRSFDTWF